MNTMYNISSSPHTRGKLNTRLVMLDVVISLLPAAVVGSIRFGFHAFLILLASVASAVVTETLFNLVAKRPNTVRDLSAVVTGLLLGLCLSPTVPLFIPVLGSAFAILFVKCFFGGLGKNFMNPALAGRCFLLISFSSIMTTYVRPDAVSSATPLADLMAGRPVSLMQMFIGTTTGVIGSSVLALMIGAVYLLSIRAIAWEIPAASFAGFALFIIIFGGHGFSPYHIAAHIMGGSMIMSAFFMASDPVTSPTTSAGQLVYGAFIGILTGVFRLFGRAEDSGSYAVIIANLVTPLIDEYIVPTPFGFRKKAGENGEKQSLSPAMVRPAFNLFVITLVAGVGLAGVFHITKDVIAEQKRIAREASYRAVLPEATVIENDPALSAAIEGLDGGAYGEAFGKVLIRDAVVGKDDSGAVVGYVASVTTREGYDGDITLSVGVRPDGTVSAISFTELHETAGMGMRAKEPAFKGQFEGVKTDAFVLNKAGGGTAENEIDSISGASITSGAVVNAVNAAIDFLSEAVK